MSYDREKAIWKRATELWETAGKQGVPEDFWDEAVREVDESFAEAPANADTEPPRRSYPD